MLFEWAVGHNFCPDDLLLSQIQTIEQALFDDAWSSSVIETVLSQFGAGMLIKANDHGEVLGYCVYQIIFETAEILRIGVGFDHQGRGIAKAMMAMFIKICQDKSAEKILLEVRTDNTSAVGLYQHFGFDELTVRKGYYHTKAGRIDALIMQKKLHLTV